MAEKKQDGTLQTPRQALEAALADIGVKGEAINGKKLAIIALNDKDDAYHVSFYQAGMSMSECVALCEVAKSLFKKEMGH